VPEQQEGTFIVERSRPQTLDPTSSLQLHCRLSIQSDPRLGPRPPDMTDSKMDQVKDDRKLKGKTNFIDWKCEFECAAKANDILEYLSSPPSHTHAPRNTISPRISVSPSRHTSPYYTAGYPIIREHRLLANLAASFLGCIPKRCETHMGSLIIWKLNHPALE
jgi:hypothetical protein